MKRMNKISIKIFLDIEFEFTMHKKWIKKIDNFKRKTQLKYKI